MVTCTGSEVAGRHLQLGRAAQLRGIVKQDSACFAETRQEGGRGRPAFPKMPSPPEMPSEIRAPSARLRARKNLHVSSIEVREQLPASEHETLILILHTKSCDCERASFAAEFVGSRNLCVWNETNRDILPLLEPS